MMRMLPIPAGSFTDPLGCEITAASDMDCLPGQREVKREGCAFSGTAVDTNLPRMFLNDAVCHREPQPGAARLSFFLAGLGGEEGIINAMNVFLGNAGTCVGDKHAYKFAILRRHFQHASSR